jgi:hypothetical protein
MQQAINDILALGQLPSSATATAVTLKLLEDLLAKVQTPLSDDEACALLKIFGPDDCFGLAWTLLHKIETAPGWPIETALDANEGDWIDRLRERAS